MRSFLIKEDDTHFISWGMIPEDIYYEGEIPNGYKLAVNPSPGIIIVDVDVKSEKNGFHHIPKHIFQELEETFNYSSKTKGRHYWLKYTGDKTLMNKSSNIGIDLRTNKGYVIFYPALRGKGDIREYTHLIKTSSKQINEWVEELFGPVTK